MNNRKFEMLAILIILVLTSLACGLGGEEESAATATSPAEDPTPQVDSIDDTTSQTASTIALGDEYNSDEGGYSFLRVPGYTTEEFFGFTTMAAPDADETEGPFILLIGGLEEEPFTLDEMFATMSDEIAGDPDVDMQVSDPTDITIDGAPGRSVFLNGTNENGTSMGGRIIVVAVNDLQLFTMVGAAPTDRWESELADYFEAVLNSVAFFEPAPVDFSFEPTQASGTESVGSGDDSSDLPAMTEIRQWSSFVFASSEYGEDSWSAAQAIGEPDTHPNCGDYRTAWASSDGSSDYETLDLFFDVPVYPTQVNIYETNSPGQIISVDVIDLEGNFYNIYEATPVLADCPNILSINITGVDVPVDEVFITLDQSVVDATWNEIDAVELVGDTDEEVDFSSGDDPGDDSAASFVTPVNFLWRAGGISGALDDQWAALGGMDIDRNNFVYVTDNIHGILIYDENGAEVERIDLDEFNNATDIVVDFNANMYVASWGNNSIFVLDVNGNLLTTIGGTEGNGPGEFGTFSPQSVAVDLDGNIYALDDNEDDNGDDFERIQVFDNAGNYLYEWRIEEDFFAATEMTFNPITNSLYVLGFVGGYIVDYDLDGNVIRRLGEDSLDFSGPQDLDVDDDGYIYVATWTPDGIMVLDSEGNFIEQLGVPVEDGDVLWGEGGFYSTGGVAVNATGSLVVGDDWSGEYAFITAFQHR